MDLSLHVSSFTWHVRQSKDINPIRSLLLPERFGPCMEEDNGRRIILAHQ